MWVYYRRRQKRSTTVTKHYQEHKKLAREFVLKRLAHFNQHYALSWNRVAIRNQRRCWGSCTSLKNLNFSYKLLFLPQELADYIVVHELCHLVELNHGPQFWLLVGEQIPDYKKRIRALKGIERGGMSIPALLKARQRYDEQGIAQTTSDNLKAEIMSVS